MKCEILCFTVEEVVRMKCLYTYIRKEEKLKFIDLSFYTKVPEKQAEQTTVSRITEIVKIT